MVYPQNKRDWRRMISAVRRAARDTGGGNDAELLKQAAALLDEMRKLTWTGNQAK